MVAPQVDIIIVTFNQEKYIDQTVASIINQTYSNFKIIIADDCSYDGTKRIIEKWASQYPDKIIPIFNEVNLGITGNSNVALRQSKGDYFIILGGDDLLYPKRVEAQVSWFAANPGAVLCGSEIDYIDENSSVIKEYKATKKRSGKGNIFWITTGMLYATISIMYKRNFKPSLEYDQRLTQVSDLKYCIDFLAAGGVYGFLDTSLSGYRKTERSYTVLNWEKSLEDRNKMYEILKNEYNPDLFPYIKKGQNYLVNYSWGMMYMQEGSYKRAIGNFFKVIIIDPSRLKAFLRIIQVLIKAISS